jgi:tetratricopeptide (TPR) repeat protein
VGLAGVLLVLLFASAASAAPIDDAKKAFAEGKAAFERGDYETALTAYQRANMILPAPNLYYNIGATYERLGRYQEAALAFDKYFEMAGAPGSDEEKEFQEKLRSRADVDRHRADVPRPVPSTPTTPPPGQPQPSVGAPQPQPAPYDRQPYYAAPFYANPQYSKETRLKEARARHTRAIVLMAIGVPMSAIGIGVLAWATTLTHLNEEWGYGFVGATFGIVGVTLWAPGAASFVRSGKEIKELSRPDPVPPSPRGF